MNLSPPHRRHFFTLLLHAAVMHAAKNASCTFDTFTAPSGYSFEQVQGISDDGTVVGQLIDNNTQEFVAFTRSASGVITKYAAPKSLNTWLYGRNSTGSNAGFYQDNAGAEHIHGFLLQGSNLPPSTIRRRRIRGCSTSTNWELRPAASPPARL